MNPVLDAIKTRRSARRLKENEEPTKEMIETILEAATWAPNHHLTEPWRFVILKGEARKNLGEAMHFALLREIRQDDLEREKKLESEKQKPLRAPVLIALISAPKIDEKVVVQEELIAAGAALQNILLAAHSLGLGAMVRTGRTSYSKEVREFFRMKENESLVGLIYLGYHSEPYSEGKRAGLENKVEWRGF